MSARRILVLGNLKGAATAALEGAAKQTDTYLTFYSRADEGIRELDHREWRAILVDITTPGASRFCHEARARRALFNVPLVGMTPQLTDLAFANAFRWGADDVVALGSSTPIVQRLLSLPSAAPVPQAARGEAVVADADRARCDVLGRVLANAGYSVRYATDLVSARYYLSKPSVTLFVLNEELGSPSTLLEEAQTLRCGAKWVIAAKQRRLMEVRDALKRFKGVAVMSSHGAPENVLFALNFLEPSPDALRRAEVRALHGTMVFFRGEGEEGDECGYTYSISAGGLYVRTLLPPPSGQLWLELEPAGAARRVRLLGEVVWSRTFGQSGAETAPPGFGVRLVSGLGRDLDTWVAGFNRLEGAQPDSHAVPEVKLTPQPFKVPLPTSLSKRPERREVPGATGLSREASPESRPTRGAGGTDNARRDAFSPVRRDDRAAHPAMPWAPASQAHRAAHPAITSPSIELALRALNPMRTASAPRVLPATPDVGDVKTPHETIQTENGDASPTESVEVNPPSLSAGTSESKASATGLSKTQPFPVRTAPSVIESSAPHSNHSGTAAPSGLTPTPETEAASRPSAGTSPPNTDSIAAEHAGSDATAKARSDVAVAPPAVDQQLAPTPQVATTDDASDEAPSRSSGSAPQKPLVDSSLPYETVVPAVIRLQEQEMIDPGVSPRDSRSNRKAPAHTEAFAEVPRHEFDEGFLDKPTPTSPLPSEESPVSPEQASGASGSIRHNTVGGASIPAVSKATGAGPKFLLAALAVSALVGGLFWLGNRRAQDEANASTSVSTVVVDSPKATPTVLRDEFVDDVVTVASQPAPEIKADSDVETPPADLPSEQGEEVEPLPPSPDASELNDDEVWLLVRSPQAARVFVHGIDLGSTNQWLRSKCGVRFVRLGHEPGQWLSEGSAYKLPCQTTMAIDVEASSNGR